jgi:hypothetical protein
VPGGTTDWMCGLTSSIARCWSGTEAGPGLFNALCCVRQAPLKTLDFNCRMILSPHSDASSDICNINELRRASREH